MNEGDPTSKARSGKDSRIITETNVPGGGSIFTDGETQVFRDETDAYIIEGYGGTTGITPEEALRKQRVHDSFKKKRRK